MSDFNQYSKSPATQNAQQINTKDLVMTGMFTAIISVLSLISIPTQPVPFTLSLLAIFLTGALLSPRNAFFAVLAYLLLGAVGVPVFANFSGGLQSLIGPTGGYLMAYPFMAFVTAIIYKYFKKYKVFALAIGMIIALALCYLIGTTWFTFTNTKGIGFYKALTYCVFPFILFDTLKIVLAISISFVIRNTAMKRI